MEAALEVVDSSLSLIKWRLKPSSLRRLHTDILALLTRMRPVVMVDYGGKMPELQERLCALLKLSQKESPVFEHMRVMVIEDMIYLTHVREFAEHVRSSMNSEVELLFVDLEQDPPKMIKQAEKSPSAMQLISILKLFSSIFPIDGIKHEPLPCHNTNDMSCAESSVGHVITSLSSELIDLSCCMQDTQITIPTLNGWLLGYPVVYLFGKEYIADAIYNLSTKSLRLYKVLVRRNHASGKAIRSEELMSFSVPYELSMGGNKEPWAEAFLRQLQAKQKKCEPSWMSLELEVSECYPQAIVL